MRNWKEVFGLVELRKLKESDVEMQQALTAGDYLKLTAEVAIPTVAYRGLSPWRQATARAMAVGLTLDSAVVCGPAAARLHGLAVLGWREPVEAVYTEGGRPPMRRRWPRGVVYRSVYLPVAETLSAHGIRVTSVPRTLMDIASRHELIDAVVAIDSARRNDPRLSKEVLLRQLCADRRYRGIGAVRRAIALSVDCSESALESQARVIVVCADLPGVDRVEPQVAMRLQSSNRVFRVDLLINGWLVVEVDGAVKYDGITFGKPTDEVLRSERQREKVLQNAGFMVLRVGQADLVEQAEGGCRLLDLIADALGRRPLTS